MNTQRRNVLAAAAGILVLAVTGCTTTGEASGDPAARRQAIDAAAAAYEKALEFDAPFTPEKVLMSLYSV